MPYTIKTNINEVTRSLGGFMPTSEERNEISIFYMFNASNYLKNLISSLVIV